ncbi:hypothetical protein TWF718_002312 [Orbilia javanica]|uniref:Cytochrome P450 n=1 Tax=Orbilia javanica TaxID=47235 RepID=A0AAN8R8N6_9PEZI
MFAAGYKFPVSPRFYEWLGPNETFAVTPPSIHRAHRGLIAPMFTKSSVQKLDQILVKHAKKLAEAMSPKPKILGEDCKVLRTEVVTKPGDGVYIFKLLRRYANDMVTEYLIGESFGLLDSDERFSCLQQIIDTLANFQHVFFAWVISYTVVHFPTFLVNALVPSGFRGLKQVGFVVIDRLRAYYQKPVEARAKTNKTIYEAIIEGGSEMKLPENVVVADLLLIYLASIETTGGALAEALYRACVGSEVQARLHEELVKAFPNKTDEVTPAKAEKVQYLIAFLKEALRMGPPFPGRITRLTPKEGTTCQGKFIPGNTSVSMSAHLMHMDEDVYPNPRKFDPERWVGNSNPASLQEKYFVPFSKGPRACPASNFAWAEMITTVATVIRRYKVSLHSDNRRGEEWVDRITKTDVGDFIITSEEHDH